MTLLPQLLAPRTPLLAPILRVLLVLWLLLERFGDVGRHLRRHLDVHPLALLHAPHVVEPLTALGLWPMTPATTDLLARVLTTACVCAVVGLGTRLALAVVAVCFITYYGVVSGWGFFNHTPVIGCQLVIALAVVPGTTAWSLDRLLLTAWRRRQQRRRGQPLLPWRQGLAPPVPRFGEVILLLVVGSLYLASGLAKLRYGGLDWLDGDVLRFYLSGQASQRDFWLGPLGTDLISAHVYAAQSPPWVRTLAQSSALCLVLSWLTVFVELSAPVLLLASRKTAVLWCLSAIGFHTAVRVMMGISFAMWSAVDGVIVVTMIVPWWLERRRRRGHQRLQPTSLQSATLADSAAVGVGEAPGTSDVVGTREVDADARPTDDPAADHAFVHGQEIAFADVFSTQR